MCIICRIYFDNSKTVYAGNNNIIFLTSFILIRPANPYGDGV